MSNELGGWTAAVILAAALLAPGGTPSVATTGEDPPAAESGETEEPRVVEIKMVARNWYWDPDRIRVVKGTRVILHIKGFDAPHAFQLKAYGLKVPIREGETTTVEFVADKVGEFTWRCGRPCGNGCPKMRGTLVVVE